ncbi:hypothetical protein Golob_022695 [Gossypium lobatum]|uniref:Uncharacterized protein n=1 Tax=Gossypium lobatum TaxID=34289 RepID=A0A7J8LHD6_9ROSI|nr:hypothetical protein [Gossypium lobatum]
MIQSIAWRWLRPFRIPL